ncbi:MAG: hypothetical protein QME21_12465 [Anaerolineales bacterium]|nr:hypothetical protein [Anaerolineales bacterium]
MPNNPPSSDRVLVMVGTRKGAVIFTSDRQRKNWRRSDLLFKSWNVMHMVLDARHQRMHAAVAHDVYGATTHYSDDLGQTWTQVRQPPAFPRPSKSGRPPGTPVEAADADAVRDQPEKVNKVWNITPGRPQEPNVLYAGVEPAALFRSEDGGESWVVNEGLFDHPHRPQWFPGAGGLALHTILLDPNQPQRLYAAISAGGCYRSDDGGQTWSPRNRNVRADFMPNPFPEFGHCVHKMTLHPSRPHVLFQQNHCGIYRSDNAGDEWVDIGEGRLPSRFGFPIAVHPKDPETIYIIPEESDEYRLSIEGKLAVWRSQDSGASWQPMTTGLPEMAHLVVLREAMATDPLEPAGIYFGASTGQLFYSRDDGDHWELMADYLPPILSVETAVV